MLTSSQRRANGVNARHKSAVLSQQVNDRLAHASHHAHVHHDIGGVGELYADLRDGRTQGTHRKRHHIQGTALHTALKQTIERRAHLRRRDPIVIGARIFLPRATHKSTVFDASHIRGIRPGQIGVGTLGCIQALQGARLHHLLAQPVVLGLRTVTPNNLFGLGLGCNLIYPLQQVSMVHGIGTGDGDRGAHGALFPQI